MQARRSRAANANALVDTDGRALLVEPHPADVQDRDGGAALLAVSRPIRPFVERVLADGAYDSDRGRRRLLRHARDRP